MVPGEFERESRKIFNKKGVLLDKITINNLNKLLKKQKLNFSFRFYEKTQNSCNYFSPRRLKIN